MTTERRLPQPGDYFVAHWGYGQTNVTFWRVVGVSASGQSVKVVRVRNRLVESAHERNERVGHMVTTDDTVMPSDEDYTEQRHEVVDGRLVTHNETVVKTKRLKWGRGTFGGPTAEEEPSFKAFSWGTHAYLWDGTPQRETNAMYGH